MSTVYWRVRRLLALGASVTTAHLLFVAAAFCEESPITDPAKFNVADIKLEGLYRISEGTVYNYLPVNIGDTLDARRVREAIRALYATGFFRDVQLRRDGNTLIVVLLERPSIESFEITGNKDIKTEDLQKSLRNVGLAAGKTFDRSVLEDVTQYLTDQYFSRGKYAVRVDAHVEEEAGNRVKIKIEIEEGKRAKIRQVNVVGNTKFKQKDVVEGFELKTPNWLSWYKQDDRYSRESLQGDLERLRNFYMDRGFANFQIESTQVEIAPEKQDIFITVNVQEGEVFKLSSVKLAGTFVVPRKELERLLVVQPGQIFNRKLITATQELIQNRLGRDGYAFAKVEPVPTPDNATHEISLTFFVDPGNRVYVRNITFSGTSKINDEVLRRELRQLEGGWLSNTSLERSKQRIQRLPYVKSVTSETTAVPDTPDRVDVNFKVEDGPSSQLGGGIGYSQSQGILLNGSFVDSNVLGTGERAAIELNTGRYSKVYSLSHTNPYFTADGVSRTLNVSYSDVSRLTSTYSTFSTKTYLAGVDFGYPISEWQTIHFGSSVQDADLATTTTSSDQLQEWVRHNGSSYFRAVGADFVLGTNIASLDVSAGWSYDSRNRTIFPTTGASHRFQVTATVPGVSDVGYMTATYQYQQYFHIPFVPLLNAVPLSLNTRASYGAALGNTTALPPNRNFFTGGPDSVRGFRDGTLGPRDSLGNPYGGDSALSGQLEALLPMSRKFSDTARVSLFFDFGQSFYLGNTQFKDKAGFVTHYGFDLNQLRTSTGISVQWLAPLGLFRFSLAMPLNYQHDDWKHYGDQTEMFQFSIGNSF
jgi:outer membrane protein insertion porin family